MNEKERSSSTQDMMLTAPLGGLIWRLAVPTMISMLVTTFYNMVDTYFVSHISDSATGAVGVAFSLMSIIQAMGFFFGHGSGNYISVCLGRGEKQEASRMASTAFFLALGAGALLLAVGLWKLDQLALLLGSTDTILPYARDYIRFILFGAPYMVASLVLNNQLRFQGRPVYAMIGLGSGALINTVLDPLLIFGFDMGVSGAALATIISQFISFVILFFAGRRQDNIRVHIRDFHLCRAYVAEIFRGGTPSLGRQGVQALSTAVLNIACKGYGDAAIAAMSVVTRIMMFARSLVIGFGQGFQPVCGFNYGAGRFDRVKAAFWYSFKVTTAFLAAASLALVYFAPAVVGMFGSESAEVSRIACTAMRLQCSVLTLSGWTVMSSMMQQNLGRVYSATFLAIARSGLFMMPLLWILPASLDMLGIQLAQPISDVLTFLVSLPLQLAELKRLTVAQRGQ